jgi:hypothetical protein
MEPLVRFAADPVVVVAVQTIDVGADDLHRTVDVGRPVSAAAGAVDIGVDRHARRVVRITVIGGSCDRGNGRRNGRRRRRGDGRRRRRSDGRRNCGSDGRRHCRRNGGRDRRRVCRSHGWGDHGRNRRWNRRGLCLSDGRRRCRPSVRRHHAGLIRLWSGSTNSSYTDNAGRDPCPHRQLEQLPLGPRRAPIADDGSKPGGLGRRRRRRREIVAHGPLLFSAHRVANSSAPVCPVECGGALRWAPNTPHWVTG